MLTLTTGDAEMEPFDEEKAKAGHPLITRNGYPGRLLASDLDSPEGPLVVALNGGPGWECIRTYDRKGQYHDSRSEHPLDLFMAPVKKWRWLLKAPTGDYVASTSYYTTKEEVEEVLAARASEYRAVQRIDETMIEE